VGKFATRAHRRGASPRKARRTRYYLTDNFLRAWLAALAGPVAAVHFRPVDQLVADAGQRLRDVEGRAFEKLVGVLTKSAAVNASATFPSASGSTATGIWTDTETNLVALNASERIIRLGSCKRSAAELVRDLPVFGGHVERFLHQFPEYADWRSNGWRRRLPGRIECQGQNRVSGTLLPENGS
jgi:hypothetical protein